MTLSEKIKLSREITQEATKNNRLMSEAYNLGGIVTFSHDIFNEVPPPTPLTPKRAHRITVEEAEEIKNQNRKFSFSFLPQLIIAKSIPQAADTLAQRREANQIARMHP